MSYEEDISSPPLALPCCPYSTTVEVLKNVAKDCYKIFGTPKLELMNSIGGFDGRGFAVFIEDIASGKIALPCENPAVMETTKTLGLSSLLGQLATVIIKEQEMSRLANTIYQEFASSGLAYMNTHGGFTEYERMHFGTFSQTFIQAYDSVLLTGIGMVKNKEEWEAMKPNMRLALIHLARIPTDIQEGLTSSHNTIGHHFGEEKPYMIEDIEIIWNIMKEGKESSLRPAHEKIQDSGGYGICPALKDGSFERSFQALFQIYSERFFGSK